MVHILKAPYNELHRKLKPVLSPTTLLLLAFIASCASPPELTGAKTFNKAMELYLLEDFRRAYIFFQASSSDPLYKEKCYYHMGICKFKLRETSEAERLLNKVIEETGDKHLRILSSFALLKLYNSAEQIEKLKAILNSLYNTNQRTISNAIRMDEFYYYMGKSFLTVRDTFKAIEMFDHLIARKDNSIYYEIAMLFKKLNSYAFKFGRFKESANAEEMMRRLNSLRIKSQIITINNDHFVVAPFNFESKEDIHRIIRKNGIEAEIIP